LTLRLALAAGLGLGIAACLYFVALVLFHGTPRAIAGLDGVLVLSSAGLWWVRGPLRGPARPSSPAWSALDCLLFAIGLAWAGVSAGLFIAEVLSLPHGEMDAWMTWDMRARFLVRAGADWRRSLAGYDGHSDYPLLLPGAIAHGWQWLGDTVQAIPIGVAAVFTAATVMLLASAVGALRGRTAGWLAGLCLLATPGFVRRGAWLYADVPLSFFFLASLALLVYWETRAAPHVGALVWAGLATGLAAWTKNEGCVLLVAVAAVYLTVAGPATHRRWRVASTFALGAAPPLALLIYFKATVAARPDLIEHQTVSQVLAQAADPGRYLEIAAALGGLLVGSPSIWLLLALPPFVALMGRTPDRTARAAARHVAAVVGLVAAAYGAIYVTTPMPLAWHLQTSLDRLLFHLWPSALFAVFLWSASPTERDAAGGLAGRCDATLAEQRPRPADAREPSPVEHRGTTQALAAI
jgi:hypothetical protein